MKVSASILGKINTNGPNRRRHKITQSRNGSAKGVLLSFYNKKHYHS